MNAAYFKRPLRPMKPFFRREVKAPREAPRPPGALTSPSAVSAHGRRSVEAPPPAAAAALLLLQAPAICQPASRRQTADCSSSCCCAESRLPPTPGVVFTVCEDLHGTASEFGRVSFGWEIQVIASFFLQLPFKTYGENGQTSSFKHNFPAADSRRPEIPAGKSSEAAFSSRRRYGVKRRKPDLFTARTPDSAFVSSVLLIRCLLSSFC